MTPVVAFVLGGAVGVALGDLCDSRLSAAEIEQIAAATKRALATTATTPAATVPAATAAPATTAATVVSRDLRDIEGIDKVFAARLQAAGIPDLQALAAVDTDQVKIQGVKPERLRQWKSMASLLHAVPAMKSNDAELLVTGVGVGAPEGLRDATEEQVRSALEKVELPEEYDVEPLISLLAELVI